MERICRFRIPFSLWILAWIFLSALPIAYWSSWPCFFLCLFPHHIYISTGPYVHSRCSLHIRIPQMSAYSPPVPCSLYGYAAAFFRHGRHNTAHPHSSAVSCCNTFRYLVHKHASCAFHDPAVWYNCLFYSVSDKEGFLPKSSSIQDTLHDKLLLSIRIFSYARNQACDTSFIVI